MRLAHVALAIGLVLAMATGQGAETENWEESLESLEAALRENPDDVTLRLERARLLAWSGEYDAALADYRRLLEAEPENADYLLGKGQALLWSGRAGEAVAVLEQARELAPDYEAVWHAEYQARVAAGADDPDFIDAARERFPDQAWSSAPLRRRHEVEVSGRYDQLNRGRNDWQELRLSWLSQRPGALGYSGYLRQAWRFDETDQEVGFAIDRALGQRWSGRLDATASPSGDFLPDWSVGADLGRSLPSGFGVEAGLRHRVYADVDVQTLRLTADRYRGSWRGAYSLYLTRLRGTIAASHAISLTRFYSARSFVGLTLSGGVEDDYVAESGRVARSTVAGAVVNGRHWLNDVWAVSWEGGVHQVRDAYERYGVQVGLRRAF